MAFLSRIIVAQSGVRALRARWRMALHGLRALCEDGSAALSESDLGASDFNKTVNNRIFPDRVAWTSALPRLHYVAIGAPTA